MTRYLTSLVFVLLLYACAATIPKSKKINGISYVASREAINEEHITPVVNVNANYAAIMPFGFIRDLANPDIRYNTDRQWYGETKAGAKQYIEELRKYNIKFMLKPQIWVWRGEFTGKIMMTSEEDWKTLEESYSKFILEYARLAQEVNAEMFCIGTELELFVKYRQDYWRDLIGQIREVYSGKLTYAANWDEYRRVPFWDQLDYIGIDAYFPLSDEKTPSLEQLREGWQPHKNEMYSFSKSLNKSVLFTEYGYRSTNFTAKEPWNADHKIKDVNLDAQINALQSLYDEFWDETWFAGGFIWKWFHAHNRSGGLDNSQFTPQNKPAEELLKVMYGKD